MKRAAKQKPGKSFPYLTTASALLWQLVISTLTLNAQQQVTGFSLIDASTDQVIRVMADLDTIDPAQDGHSLSIRAETEPALVGSVVFLLNGNKVRTESSAPYAFAGDNSGDYAPMDLPAGDHVITATPFSESGGGGTAGISRSQAIYMMEGSGSSDNPGGPVQPPADSGTGIVVVTGELKRWHRVTIDVDGPYCRESDIDPNPFLDIRLEALFVKDSLVYRIPGYFAADGDAANTGAEEGGTWRVHFAPPDTGTWYYTLNMRLGRNVAVSDSVLAGESLPPVNGAQGSFEIMNSDKSGRDLRAWGMLEYVGGHYLRFAGTGDFFLKQGADAPENFLAYSDFDGNFKSDGIKDQLVKDWAPHVIDWGEGDPVWAGGKGKGIIGAINYLASEGMNAFSFIPMNIEGDDRNVFPYIDYQERYHMDISRLDQWEIVFEHATQKGMYLHFKTQETENETLLDGGDLGLQRRFYYRELIARFSHHLALNWNLGEEINDQTLKQRQDMADYFWSHDPYRHHIVIHNGRKPDDMLGNASRLTGFSLQTSQSDFSQVHGSVLEWVNKSARAGKPWVVACDEPGDASHALVPDKDDPSHDNARKNALWGTFMAGGAGNEWYFGYQHDHSDLTCNDFRSRDLWWDQCLQAMRFFEDYTPFWDMKNHNSLTSGDYCFADPGQVYTVFLKNGGNHILTLEPGVYDLFWFDTRNGGNLKEGDHKRMAGPGAAYLGLPPFDETKDWVALVRKNRSGATGSDDARLLDLIASAGTLDPMFHTRDTAYTLTLPPGVVSVTLTATPSDVDAMVTGTGIYDALNGSDTANIVVTSQDRTRTRTYRVFITAIPLSDDTSLSGLVPGEGILAPPFNSGIILYSLTLPPGASSVHIAATTSHPNATVSGTGNIDVSTGRAVADLVVTAEDGITTTTYSIDIKVEPTGLSEPANGAYGLYPNPASGSLWITGVEPGTMIRLVDQRGQVRLTRLTLMEPERIEVSGIEPGIYLILKNKLKEQQKQLISIQ